MRSPTFSRRHVGRALAVLPVMAAAVPGLAWAAPPQTSHARQGTPAAATEFVNTTHDITFTWDAPWELAMVLGSSGGEVPSLTTPDNDTLLLSASDPLNTFDSMEAAFDDYEEAYSTGGLVPLRAPCEDLVLLQAIASV